MLLGWCVVAIDFPSFMELRFIDMKEKWLLTSSLLARERNERLSKTSKAELDGAISILASLPRSTEAAAARTAITQPHITYTTHVHFFPTQSGITRLRRRVSSSLPRDFDFPATTTNSSTKIEVIETLWSRVNNLI